MNLRLLADENIPRLAVVRLREAGHDVAWVTEDSPGITDEIVINRASQEQRTLLTFDRDFGELAFKYGQTTSSGIVLLRLPITPPDTLAATLVALFNNKKVTFTQRFTTLLDEGRIRQRPLPGD